MIDKIISEVDFALKLFTVPQKGLRTSPSENVSNSNHELSDDDIKQTARLMRVNHTGEVCAQALYRGQLFFNSDEVTGKALKHAAIEEIDHLNWCEQRIEELGGKTSFLNPIFYMSSFSLGAIAGKIDNKFNLGFLEETEKQVTAHLEGHINKISKNDKKTHAILEQMKYDEQCHQKTAKSLGSKELPSLFQKIMNATSKLMTKTTYWI
jgi:ubiquinone biosynthesis monooxygenase Coq7